jgi:hypothetical protein
MAYFKELLQYAFDETNKNHKRYVRVANKHGQFLKWALLRDGSTERLFH